MTISVQKNKKTNRGLATVSNTLVVGKLCGYWLVLWRAIFHYLNENCNMHSQIIVNSYRSIGYILILACTENLKINITTLITLQKETKGYKEVSEIGSLQYRILLLPRELWRGMTPEIVF